MRKNSLFHLGQIITKASQWRIEKSTSDEPVMSSDD